MWDTIDTAPPQYDPGNEYAINYMWGTTGLGVNDKVTEILGDDAPMSSWDLIFDPENMPRNSRSAACTCSTPRPR